MTHELFFERVKQFYQEYHKGQLDLNAFAANVRGAIEGVERAASKVEGDQQDQ